MKHTFLPFAAFATRSETAWKAETSDFALVASTATFMSASASASALASVLMVFTRDGNGLETICLSVKLLLNR
jgi:hypothetical protein